MVSVWFSWLHNHVKDNWFVICLGDDHYTTHKRSLIKKLPVVRVLYPSTLEEILMKWETRNTTLHSREDIGNLQSIVKRSQFNNVGVGGIGDGLGRQIIVFHQLRSQCSFLPGDFRELYASSCWLALWKCWFYLSTVAIVPKLVAGLTGQQTHPY